MRTTLEAIVLQLSEWLLTTLLYLFGAVVCVLAWPLRPVVGFVRRRQRRRSPSRGLRVPDMKALDKLLPALMFRITIAAHGEGLRARQAQRRRVRLQQWMARRNVQVDDPLFAAMERAALNQ